MISISTKRDPGNLLCDFLLTRLADDHDVIGSYAKGLLALEERGKWDEERVASVINA